MAKPVITKPLQEDTTQERKLIVEGTADPFSQVSILVDGNKANINEQCKTNNTGSWRCELPIETILSGQNSRKITLTVTSVLDGHRSPPSDPISVRVVLPEPSTSASTQGGSPNNPQITVAKMGLIGVIVTGLLSLLGVISAAIINNIIIGTPPPTDSPALSKNALQPPSIQTPTDGESVISETPVITGIGKPGTRITVFIDGKSQSDQILVNDGGDWQYDFAKLGKKLDRGPHQIKAIAKTNGEEPSLPSEYINFSVEPNDSSNDLIYQGDNPDGSWVEIGRNFGEICLNGNPSGKESESVVYRRNVPGYGDRNEEGKIKFNCTPGQNWDADGSFTEGRCSGTVYLNDRQTSPNEILRKLKWRYKEGCTSDDLTIDIPVKLQS